MATFTKRGNLQWQAKIRRKGYPDQSRTFETKIEAETWARQVEGEMDRGVYISRAEAERTTLREAVERFIGEYLPRLADPYKEKRRAAALQRRAIASRVLASLRSKDIADFIRERGKTMRRSCANSNVCRMSLTMFPPGSRSNAWRRLYKCRSKHRRRNRRAKTFCASLLLSGLCRRRRRQSRWGAWFLPRGRRSIHSPYSSTSWTSTMPRATAAFSRVAFCGRSLFSIWA